MYSFPVGLGLSSLNSSDHVEMLLLMTFNPCLYSNTHVLLLEQRQKNITVDRIVTEMIISLFDILQNFHVGSK